MNQDFLKSYKAKLPPLNDSLEQDRRTIKQQQNQNTIDDDSSVIETNQYQNNPQALKIFGDYDPKIQKTQPPPKKSYLMGQSQMEDKQGENDAIFDKSQTGINGFYDNDSIIEGDQSKNYLKSSYRNVGTSQKKVTKEGMGQNIVLKAQNLDEIQVNEDNETLNKIDDNESSIDQDKLKQLKETQQYIDDTFKNMISSQKQQLYQQQQMQQQQQLSQDNNNYEPPQCRVCLEVYEDNEPFNKSHTINFHAISYSQQHYTDNKSVNMKQQFQGPLISPCKCAGSSKYVHEKCLKDWIISTYEDYSLAQCEVCKVSYVQQLTYEKKCKFNQKYLKSKPRCFFTSFLIWVLFTHLFVITSFLFLIDIVTPDSDVPIFDKSIISNTAIYILFSFDVLCDILCLVLFMKYYLNLFRIKTLIDWQIMNFTKHPKEKHPKLIEKFYEGRGSREMNSATNRNLQLQLMMNNSIDNRNMQSNSVHNHNSMQGGCGLSHSQVSKQTKINHSMKNSQKMKRNGSNIQTINYFANMGVSEKILHNFLNQQDDYVINQPKLPAKSLSNIMKKCDSEDGDNEERISQFQQSNSCQSNYDQKGKVSPNTSVHKLSAVQQHLINQQFNHGDRFELRKESNNFLTLPQDDRSPDKFKSQSTHFGFTGDNFQKKDINQQWKRHVFYAKNQPYEIIIKPSDNQEVKQLDHPPKAQAKAPTERMPQSEQEQVQVTQQQRFKNASLQKFFEQVSQSRQADEKTETQSKAEIEKKEQKVDKHQVFRECESFESHHNNNNNNNNNINNNDFPSFEKKPHGNSNFFTESTINLKKSQEDQSNNQQQPISEICMIKQKSPINKSLRNSTSQKLQDILYQKIQQNNPQIQSQFSIPSTSKREAQINSDKDKGSTNIIPLLSSANTQINSQGMSDSQTQTTQINNKSFLSSNHQIPSMQKVSSTISESTSKKDENQLEVKEERHNQQQHQQQLTNSSQIKHISAIVQEELSEDQNSHLEVNAKDDYQNLEKTIETVDNEQLRKQNLENQDIYIIDLENN